MSTDNNFRQTCAKRIRQVREKIGETRKEFAARLSVASSTYAKYETAETQPTFSTLVQIADIGNVSTDYLLGRTNAREKPFSILDELGLTQESAQVLADLHNKEEMGDLSDIINEIIEHKLFKELMFYISRYLCIDSKSFHAQDFYSEYGKFVESGKKGLYRLAYDAGFDKTEIPVILTDSIMASRLFRHEAVDLFDRILRQLISCPEGIKAFDWNWMHSYGDTCEPMEMDCNDDDLPF